MTPIADRVSISLEIPTGLIALLFVAFIGIIYWLSVLHADLTRIERAAEVKMEVSR